MASKKVMRVGPPMLADIAAAYDFTNLPLGPIATVVDPIQGCNLVQVTGSRQPIAVDYNGDRCAYFDGSDDYMDAISTTGMLAGKDSGTIIAVMAREDKSGSMNVCMYSKANNTTMMNVRYSGTSNNSPRLSARMSSESLVSATSTENKADGAFTYVVTTAKRNSVATIKQRNIAKITQSGLSDNPFTPTIPWFTVGVNYNSVEASRLDYFKGWIKAIYVFNRALTDEEVNKFIEDSLYGKFKV